MGEYTRAAYSPTDGNWCAADPRRAARIGVEEFRLRIGAVRTRRRNAEAAFEAHENVDSGWSPKNYTRLKAEVLEARSEELRLVHALVGEDFVCGQALGTGHWALVENRCVPAPVCTDAQSPVPSAFTIGGGA